LLKFSATRKAYVTREIRSKNQNYEFKYPQMSHCLSTKIDNPKNKWNHSNIFKQCTWEKNILYSHVLSIS